MLLFILKTIDYNSNKRKFMNYKEIIEREGDYHEWTYTTKNDQSYECWIKRHSHSKHWCGYIVITQDNKWWGKQYIELPIHVHGSLTYGSGNDGVYGFDCAHWRDMTFDENFEPFNEDTVYRDKTYVIDECEKMAEQFSAWSISGRRKEKIDQILDN